MVKLRNPGRVRISYDVERADFTMLGAIGAQGQWNNHNGVLHPDEESSFYLLPLAIPRGLAIGDSATTAIRVRYWDDPNIRHTLSQELEIVVTGVNPLRWRWSYTAGPTYA
jgi:hypothetical protein